MTSSRDAMKIEHEDGAPEDGQPVQDNQDLYRVEYRIYLTANVDTRATSGVTARQKTKEKIEALLNGLEAVDDNVKVLTRTVQRNSVWKSDT